MAHKELSSTQFADTLEVPRATVSHILSERNKPSLDVIVKIISTFREVSLGWLLLGEGEMFATPGSSAAVETEPEPAKEPVPPLPPNEAPPAAIAGTLSSRDPAREIAQIVIFYADHSFTAYKPS